MIVDIDYDSGYLAMEVKHNIGQSFFVTNQDIFYNEGMEMFIIDSKIYFLLSKSVFAS